MSASEGQAPNPFGQICWLEVPVEDAARAQKFYTAVFGWECKAESMSSPAAGIKELWPFSRGLLHGCLAVMEPGSRIANADLSNPAALPLLPTLRVRSIEDTLEKAAALGGKTLVGKTAIGGEMGFFARVIDSEGNLVGVWCQN